MVIGTLVMQLAPRPLLQLFHASAHMMNLGIPALRIISLHFPIAAASIVFSAAFQAFSRSFYALVVSVARQLGVLIPVAYLLSLTGDVNKIWFSFVIAESLSLLLSLFLLETKHRFLIILLNIIKCSQILILKGFEHFYCWKILHVSLYISS